MPAADDEAAAGAGATARLRGQVSPVSPIGLTLRNLPLSFPLAAARTCGPAGDEIRGARAHQSLRRDTSMRPSAGAPMPACRLGASSTGFATLLYEVRKPFPALRLRPAGARREQPQRTGTRRSSRFSRRETRVDAKVSPYGIRKVASFATTHKSQRRTNRLESPCGM